MDIVNNPSVEEARAAAKKSCREVSQQILLMLPVIEESLETMTGHLKEQDVDSSTAILHDVSLAFQAVAKALPTALYENPDIEKVNQSIADMRESLIVFIEKYEARDISDITSALAAQLKPAFKSFHQEVEVVLAKVI